MPTRDTAFSRVPASAARRRLRAACPVAAAAFAVLAPGLRTFAVDPLLTLDLRVHDTGGKSATVSNLGDVVTMDLYAVLRNADANAANDGLSLVGGSYLSSNAGLLGALNTLNPSPAFSEVYAGVQHDLDLDGDLDVGGLEPNVAAEFVIFSSGAAPLPAPTGGLFLGEVQFTALDLAGGTTQVNWRQRVRTSGSAPLRTTANVLSDGVNYALLGDSPLITLGAPVTISYVPPSIPPGETRQFTTWNVNAPESNTGGTVLADQIRVGVTAPGSYSQSAGFTQASQLTLGTSAGVSGTWTQTGGNVLATTVVVGGAGNGDATHSGGTATYSSLRLGTTGGGTGRVEVTGSAQLTVTGAAVIGSGARGTFVQSGGNSSFSNGINLQNASVSVTGGALTASRITLTSSTTATRTQAGGTVSATTIDLPALPAAGAGSSYELQRGTLSAGSLSMGGTFRQSGGTSNIGLVDAIGAGGSRFELTGGDATTRAIWLGKRATGSTNAVLSQTGGTLRSDSFDVSPRGRYEFSGGTLEVTRRLISAGVIDLSNAPVAVNIANGALVDFARFWGSSGGVLFTGGQLLNAANATITAGTNSFINFPAGFDIDAGIGTLTSQGIVHIDGTPVTIPAGRRIGGSGGIAGDVTNHGVISPGNSPGALTVQGNFAQSDVGSLVMEIAGTDAEAYDTLSVSGAALLDGTLQVALLEGFIPAANDRFAILSAGSLNGIFDNAPSTVALAEGTFAVEYTTTGVTLTGFTAAVPEPGTAAATFLIAGAATAFGRRRRGARAGAI
jgi:hypothetical protein